MKRIAGNGLVVHWETPNASYMLQHLCRWIESSVQRSLSLSRLLTERILASHFEDKEAIQSVVAKLNGDYPTHSFPLMPEELAETGLDIKPMSAEVSAIAYRILSYYKLLSAAGGSLTDDERESWRTLAVFESEELRTNYAYTAKERFIENTWTRWDYSAGYTHYTLLQKKKRHFEVNYLVNDQVTRWMSGEEIVVD